MVSYNNTLNNGPVKSSFSYSLCEDNMMHKKILSATLLVTVLTSLLYYLFLIDLGKTYEDIGESLNVTEKPIKTLILRWKCIHIILLTWHIIYCT